MKGRLYVMVGLPGSGKSTLAKAMAEKTGGTIVCLDDIREELFGSAEIQDNPIKVVNTAMWRVQKGLEVGKTVIYDATNLKRAYRRRVLSMKPYCESIDCIVVDTPLEECIKRNNGRSRVVPEEVIRMKAERSSPVLPSEGFDRVLYVNDTYMDAENLLRSRE